MKKKAGEIAIGGLCRNLTQNITTNHGEPLITISPAFFFIPTPSGEVWHHAGEKKRRHRCWNSVETAEIQTTNLSGRPQLRKPVWISVVGLRFAMGNHQVLGRMGNDLGGLVRADPGPIKRKEKIQHVRDVLDVQNHIPAEHIFNYSPEIFVKLSLKVERAHKICKECGFFGHGGGTYDRGLICGRRDESEVQTEEALSMELKDGLEGSVTTLVIVKGSLAFSTGNPSFKLGLIKPRSVFDSAGPEGTDRLKVSGLGGLKRKLGFGTDLGKKHKSCLNFGELVEVPVKFGKAPMHTSPKKRGRRRGSRNKKNSGIFEVSDSMAPSSVCAEDTSLLFETEEL
ncbi:hypothetical protein ACLB2K_029250 [Fragaria x ananassa]